MCKGRFALILLIALTGCTPNPPQHDRPMLDGAPWPLDANGQIATGTTILQILVNYHGVAVKACVYKSSGSDALDASAIRRMTKRLYQPEMKSGFPASSYIRVPVYFGSTPVLPPQRLKKECQPQPVPGVSPAELALVVQTQVTVFPTAKREVPEVGQQWPTDANGKLINLDAYESILVDPAGRVVRVVSLRPNIYTAFNTNAADMVAKMIFPSSDVQHWDVVSFHFRRSE